MMVAFNNEISAAEKIGLHLSEVGRIQNNAGSMLQFVTILFAICVYFFNAYVFPAGTQREMFGPVLLADSFVMVLCSFLYLRCLSFSVGWQLTGERLQRKRVFLSHLSETDVERTLSRIVRDFRLANYCFFSSFFLTLLLLVLLAFGTMQR